MSDVLIIPTSTTLEDYDEQVELDGVTYTLRFRWNAAAGSWFLDVLDAAGDPLVFGRRCVADTLFMEQTRHVEGMFLGRLFAFDTTRSQIDPALLDFGTRVLLCYVTEA